MIQKIGEDQKDPNRCPSQGLINRIRVIRLLRDINDIFRTITGSKSEPDVIQDGVHSDSVVFPQSIDRVPCDKKKVISRSVQHYYPEVEHSENMF
jgi:hypothetical protein